MSGKSVWGQPLFFWCCASSLMFWEGGGSCQGTWLMRGRRAARCVGYPIPSARAAVRKVPLGGDTTWTGTWEKFEVPAGRCKWTRCRPWAPRIMKRYAWKVFSFRLLLCTSNRAFDAQCLSRGRQFCCCGKEMGHTRSGKRKRESG